MMGLLIIVSLWTRGARSGQGNKFLVEFEWLIAAAASRGVPHLRGVDFVALRVQLHVFGRLHHFEVAVCWEEACVLRDPIGLDLLSLNWRRHVLRAGLVAWTHIILIMRDTISAKLAVTHDFVYVGLFAVVPSLVMPLMLIPIMIIWPVRFGVRVLVLFIFNVDTQITRIYSLRHRGHLHIHLLVRKLHHVVSAADALPVFRPHHARLNRLGNRWLLHFRLIACLVCTCQSIGFDTLRQRRIVDGFSEVGVLAPYNNLITNIFFLLLNRSQFRIWSWLRKFWAAWRLLMGGQTSGNGRAAVILAGMCL